MCVHLELPATVCWWSWHGKWEGKESKSANLRRILQIQFPSGPNRKAMCPLVSWEEMKAKQNQGHKEVVFSFCILDEIVLLCVSWQQSRTLSSSSPISFPWSPPPIITFWLHTSYVKSLRQTEENCPGQSDLLLSFLSSSFYLLVLGKTDHPWNSSHLFLSLMSLSRALIVALQGKNERKQKEMEELEAHLALHGDR